MRVGLISEENGDACRVVLEMSKEEFQKITDYSRSVRDRVEDYRKALVDEFTRLV